MVQGATISSSGGGDQIGFKVNLVGDAKRLFDVGVIADLLEEALQYGEQVAHNLVPYDTGNLTIYRALYSGHARISIC